MSSIDLSRSATDFRKHFTGVRAQMGRVMTDDDHNENERIHDEDMRRSRVDIIGPAGSPDAGFSIANPVINATGIDFDIVAGTLYLGGNRLTLEATEKFQVQSDWLDMDPSDIPPAPGGVRSDLVYLECWRQSVSAVEDSELFEVALGGPDTGTRMRLMRRVRVIANSSAGDCQDDWNTLIGNWSAAGLGTINNQDELVVDTTLQVGFVSGPPGDLCTPAIAGGYLGAENQAIRVQLVDAASFTWGFDNAAPLYRVQIGNNGLGQKRKITMETEPRDQAHWPVAGQIVELLPWSAKLPNLEKVAEVSGFLACVDTSYDPDTQELFLTSDVPAGFGEQWLNRPDANDLKPEFFFMRMWNRGSDAASPLAIPFVNGTPVTLGNTGLTVTFSGNDHHPNDYWIIAARPESPNLVVPWLLETGRGPHGIRRWYTPLAVIQWSPGAGGIVIHDCRDTFPPLTRVRGCCTYSVGDGIHSFGDFTSIQKAINALPGDGGEVCIRPGIYKENVILKGRHDVRIHGCGSHTLLEEGGKHSAPVITVEDSQRIQICDLAIEAEFVIGIQLLSTPAAAKKNAGLRDIAIHHLQIASRDTSAIDCRGGQDIFIEHNRMTATELAAPLGKTNAGLAPLVFVRADDVLIERNAILASGSNAPVTPTGGVQIGGGSEHVAIRRNRIHGGNGNGITLGSITYVSVPGTPLNPAGGIVVTTSGINAGGYTQDENGCINPDPDPGDPTGPNGPLTPQSDGDLLDIRIIDNEISAMGQNGISTLRYFRVGVINVRGLDMEMNRILRCVQLELSGKPVVSPLLLGYGGVALISVERFTLRNNLIEQCGVSFIDPICGVYILISRGFIAEGNQICDNGLRIQTCKQPTAGPRGGILIGAALTPLLGGDVPVPGTGFPAARIDSNIVIAPFGRALELAARGLVLVANNELASWGVDRESTIGVAVLISNLGVAYEIAPYAGFSTMGTNQPATGLSTAAQRIASGGEILFGHNEVLLAPLNESGPAIFTSIELLSLDDIQFENNQCEARVGKESLTVNGFALGWSVRMNGNRFEEFPAPGLSGLTIGAYNCTTMNQGTRCFAVAGVPALTVDTGNRSLTTLLAQAAGNPDPCAVFQRRFSAVMTSFGLSG
jgi:hypothetical protein